MRPHGRAAQVLLALALLGAHGSAPPAHAVEIPALAQTARIHGLRLEVGAAEFPEANAVILLDRLEKIGTDRGSHLVRHHRIVKILRQPGRSLANIRRRLPAKAEFSVSARTLSPGGELVWMQGSDVQREPVVSMDPFEGASQVVSYTFPAVREGAILESVATWQVDDEIVADVRVFDDHFPVLVAQYVLGHPEDQSYRVFADGSGVAGLKRARAITAGGRPLVMESFELRDLPAIPREPSRLDLLPQHPHLFVVSDRAYTARSADAHWQRLADALASIQRGPRHGLEKQRAYTRELLLKAGSRDERVREVVDWLARRIRIETQRLVSEHYRTGEEVLESGVAEPMEWAVLLAGSLNGCDIPAYLAFVNSASNLELDRRVPWSGFFDRFVVLVPGAERTWVFDPLAPDPRTGVGRWDVQGRTALVARPHAVKESGATSNTATVEFRTLPAGSAESNLDERRFRVRLRGDGVAVVGWDQTLRGEPAWELLELKRDGGWKVARDAARSALASLLGDADPQQLELSFPDKRSASVRGEVATRGLLLSAPEGLALMLGALERWPELEALSAPPPGSRKSGLDLGYPRQFRTTIAVDLEAGRGALELPPPVLLNGPGLRFEASTRRTPQGFERSSTLTLSDPTLELTALRGFDDFLGQLRRAGSVAIPVGSLP